jgi:hypothetical protein
MVGYVPARTTDGATDVQDPAPILVTGRVVALADGGGEAAAAAAPGAVAVVEGDSGFGEGDNEEVAQLSGGDGLTLVVGADRSPGLGGARGASLKSPAAGPGPAAWHLSGQRSRVVPGRSVRAGPAQKRRDRQRRSRPRRYPLRSTGGSTRTW